MSKNNGGPSLKKKFVGLIRHLSQPGCTSDQSNDNSRIATRPDTFIHKYLQGEGRSVQPTIIYGRSVEELPPRALSRLRQQTFAAFTGPGGGLTAVNRNSPALEITEPDVDFIDNENALPDDQPNAYVTGQIPPPPPDPDLKRSEKEEIAGILNWNRPHERAFGLSTTLYERHPITYERAGNPIADAFGVIARGNNAILALADGVNWGEEASLAAKCAIHGCLSHINTALFSAGVAPPHTTTDLFVALLRSFHSAHNLILQEEGMLTTLTVAIVAPQQNSDKFVACVCNVGDSLAYVYSQKYGVREITQGSHDIYSMRDMRDALGALGPVDGQNPELNNLTCSMTFCEEGDIIFLTSDGISDNFDPVVGKFVLPRPEPKESKSTSGGPKLTQTRSQVEKSKKESAKNGRPKGEGHAPPVSNHGRSHRTPPRQQQRPQSQQAPGRHQRDQSTQMSQKEGFRQPVSRSKSQPAVCETEAYRHDPYLPIVEAHQRHELTLLRMEDLLRCGLTSTGPVTSAQALCFEMVHFATKLTVAKRRILEDPDLYPPAGAPQDLSRNDQRNRRRKVCEKLALVPGKLDHATVVAFTIGRFSLDDSNENDQEDDIPVLNQPIVSIKRGAFRAPLASPDSSKSIASHFEEAARSRQNSCSLGTTFLKCHSGAPTLATTEECEAANAPQDAKYKEHKFDNVNKPKNENFENQNFRENFQGKENKNPNVSLVESKV